MSDSITGKRDNLPMHLEVHWRSNSTKKESCRWVSAATSTIFEYHPAYRKKEYNQKLSDNMAKETQKIIEDAIANSGMDHVKFETAGFSADPAIRRLKIICPKIAFITAQL